MAISEDGSKEPENATTAGDPGHISSNTPHDHLAGHSDGHQHPHVSHAVALTTDILDPAAAQHVVEREEQWIEDKLSESEGSSTGTSTGLNEKQDITIDEEEKGDALCGHSLKPPLL